MVISMKPKPDITQSGGTFRSFAKGSTSLVVLAVLVMLLILGGGLWRESRASPPSGEYSLSGFLRDVKIGMDPDRLFREAQSSAMFEEDLDQAKDFLLRAVTSQKRGARAPLRLAK